MSKPWLLWTHDPCPEGGWHIYGEFDTKDLAVEAAKTLDAEEKKRHFEMVDFCKDDPMPYSACYDGCMVTPSEVFRIDWGKEPA